MSKIPIERLFSLASFEGLKLIRTYAKGQPSLDTSALIKLIEKIDPDGASLDLEASAHLHTVVEPSCSLDNPIFYQICIKAVVIQYRPLWVKAMRQGRGRFVETLGENDRDVFAAAGLMNNSPSPEIVLWWDDIMGHTRLMLDLEKMQQARAAERLSIEHEYARLLKLGIDKEPIWTGLDDNYAGYDVLSYDLGEHGPTGKMIEVKSTIASPLRFIITRNEWDAAIKIGSAYVFHVWDMARTPPILHVRTVEEISLHIPNDQQDGKWSSATIPINV